MTIRLFCILGILVCMVISWLAPHYLNACKVIGYGFLGIAVLDCFLERDTDQTTPSKQSSSQQEPPS
ncbi:MAG: hypothetical protein IJ934_03560 [Acetobacter sp.]|nr:hypothetical protein [Acetobacter sp.]MBR2124241.1 hypothetical protein [Acetobacter sp.]